MAEELKKIDTVRAPAWAGYVKTGHFKTRPPLQSDWWYTRSAAVLRSVARLGPVGVSKLRHKYGGKKDRGHKTEHTYKGSGNIIRKVLQQMEQAGLVEKTEKGVHKGRALTGKGHSFIDKIATQIAVELEKSGVKEPETSEMAVKKAAQAEEIPAKTRKSPKKSE